jgi:hypothetical protein
MLNNSIIYIFRLILGDRIKEEENEGSVACMGRIEILVPCLKEIKYLKDVGIDGKAILRCVVVFF